MILYNKYWWRSCLAVVVLALAGCDSTVKAPPPENVGLGRIYCQVNGQNWTNPSYFPYSVVGVSRTEKGDISIGADNYFDPKGGSTLVFDFDSLMIGPQLITHARFARMRSDECDSCGTVNLTEIDTLPGGGTLRGTFEFRLLSANGDSIVVSNGRFYVPVYFKF